MKTKALFICVFLGLMGFICQGNDGVPVAISPGSNLGVGSVENRCPTFSWSGVAWAQKYRVVVFGVEDERTKISGEMKLSVKPLLSEDIAGGGLAWTPSSSQGLAEGSDYVWYVGAMDAGGAWAWSASRRFRVEASAKVALSEGDMSGSKQKVSKNETSAEAALRAAAGSANGKAIGEKASQANAPDSPMGSEGTYSTFYGNLAGVNNSNDSNANSFFGSNAGNANTSGFGNTFIGYLTGKSNTTGRHNIFVGNSSGFTNTTGLSNIFIGNLTGYSNTVGEQNTFVGNNSGYTNSGGSNNTFLGHSAGYTNTTGSRNVYLGVTAGYNETGSDKLYIANSDTSSPLIYGDFSSNMVGINGWLGVGTQAPAYPMELKTTGINAAFVANRSGGAINYINATDTFGNFGTVNNFPLRLTVNAAWKLRLNADNSLLMANGASCTAGGVWTNASSLTLKENITTLTGDEAASTLQSLNPVKYNYKADKAEQYVGFIAEEVPELVAMNDRKALSPMDIVAVLTKVTQDQQKQLQEQQKIVQEQQQFIKQQLQINEEMKKEIAELKKKQSK